MGDQLAANGFGTRLNSPVIANADVDGRPNVFANPLEAYRGYRNARAGEVGGRNPDDIRSPSYVVLDLGLGKSFRSPFGENQRLQFRVEAFNLTNTQRLGDISAFGINQDSNVSGDPSEDFGRYSSSQTPVGESRPGRVFQFVFRYEF